MRNFLFSFAIRDLFQLSQLFVTSAVILLIALLVAVVAGGGGMFEGYKSVYRYRASLGFTVGDPRFEESRPSPAKIAELRDRLAKGLPPDVFQGCFPFQMVQAKIELPHKGESRRSIGVPGRTVVSFADPLLRQIALREGGKPFAVGDEAGLIVSPRLLAELEIAEGDAPAEFRVHELDRAGGASFMVPIRGVATRELPGGAAFLITEPYYRQLNRDHSNRDAIQVQALVLSAAFNASTFLSNVKRELRRAGVTVDEVEVDGKPAVRLTKESPWAISIWKSWLNETFTNELKQDGRYGDGDIFGEPVPVGAAVEEPELVMAYEHVCIYISDPDNLEKAVELARPFPPDRELKERLYSIGTLAKLGGALLTFAAPAIGCVAAIALGVIFWQRASQKHAEIGFLKAMGLGEWELFWLFCLQGGILWSCGCAFGMLIVTGIGFWVAPYYLAEHAGEQAYAFAWLWPSVIAGLGSFFVSLLASLGATLDARRSSPIESFGAN